MNARILILLLALLMLTGCSLRTAEEQLAHRIDAVEERIEAAVEAPIRTAATPTLTEEEATAIALEHAGFTADEVTGLRVTYEIDDRVPEYEIEFYQNRQEYDYTIHAETGKILSFDQSD